MKKYDHKKIEKKWQKEWLTKETFVASNKSKKDKKFILVEFPYPSGAGLHMGHMRPFIAGDVVSKFWKLKGFNVMYPIGWDAFGLPAENYAIKNKVHPRISTEKNIKNAKRQLQSWGTGFDWSREINTTDPTYYKWTQWIFLQFLKEGLAYQSTGLINWCPKDKTGLANEEVIDGKCERCGTVVEKKELRQWYLKITAYAEKLLKGLNTLTEWPEAVTLQQEKWIGKSQGSELEFPITNTKKSVKVFTTRADTLFGVTYVVLAPEHVLIDELKPHITNYDEVEKYINDTKNKSDIDRTAEGKEKSGVELKGITVTNPATNEQVPLWVADYVLATYGTGAVMAVPAHDERDFEFAQKYSLPIKEVIRPALVDHVNPPRADKSSKIRRNIHAIVFDPKTKKYLILKNEKFGWNTVVIGGVEDNEDLIEAAKREVAEETGYVDLEFKRILGNPVQASYFAKHKDENRVAIASAIYFELKSNKTVEIPTDGENEGNEITWIDKNDFVPGKMVNSELPLWLERLHAQKDVAYTGEGILINSEKFDGITSEKVRKEITKFVKGKTVTRYRLRDWVFSRQRYWGEPIPVIHCEKCGVVPVPEKDLPLTLPNVKKYEPTGTGESPLAAVESWVNTKCPTCKGKATRETNTMPQWAGSSWYWLRYADPQNKKAFADMKALKYWTPVDYYFGGMEHTTLHLLYSRFWNLFLFDQGLVPESEPYKMRVPHGIILGPDGEKMSKSRGNVVNPDDMVNLYGADTTRMYMQFLGPHGQQVAWNDKGVVGIRRFIERVWNLQGMITKESSKEVEMELHRTIKKVSGDLQEFSFNTAISAMMILVNKMYEVKQVTNAELETFITLLAPFAPHLAEEIWQQQGKKDSVFDQKWPQYDEKKCISDSVIIVAQINGKVRVEVTLNRGASQSEVESLVLGLENVKKWIEGKEIKKIIYIPNKLMNIVVA